MQEGPSGGQDHPGAPGPAPAEAAGPAGGSDPLAAEAAELRRMVDAGAGSPEELRALAARLREHRQREEARWRAEVKPQLVKQGKGRLRRRPPDPLPPPALPGPGAIPPPLPPEATAGGGPEPPTPTPGVGLGGPWVPTASPPVAQPVAEPTPGARALWIGLGLLAMVGVAILAARTTVWVLVLPVVGLLVWAWSQGRNAAP